MKYWIVAVIAALSMHGVSYGAVLKADYQFANTFASTVSGAADLIPIGQGSPATTGTFSTETVDGHPNVPVFNFSSNRGLIADTSAILATNDYSVVFYARLTVTDPTGTPPLSPIEKILDFKNRTSDAGQYVVGGVPTFYDGLLPVVPGAGMFTTGNYAQFALTRDIAGTVNAYLDGSPLYSFSDSGNLTTLDQNLLTLFADDPNSAGVPTGLQVEAADGAIARLRLYHGALTAAEVAGLDTIAVPEPATGGALIAGGIIALAWNRKKAKSRSFRRS
jgi:hypothetical protein